MSVVIRPFDPGKYELVASIVNASAPRSAVTVGRMRDWDENKPAHLKAGRWVGEMDGSIMAVGEFSQSSDLYHPRKFQIGVNVLPPYQRRGVGSALYDFIAGELERFDPIAYQGRAYADEERSLRFLGRRGFREDFRTWESILDVDSFNPRPWHSIEDRLAERGIRIQSLAELTGDPGRDRQAFELEQETTRDIPSPESITSHRETLSPEETEERFARYVVRALNHPNRPLEAYFVAIRDGEYVGLTYFELDDEHRRAEILMTGVKAGYRGQGIATALKLRGVAFAREHGYHTIVTGNDTANLPMLAINDKMGFIRQPELIFFEKPLGV